MRAIGVTEFLAREFDCYEFEGRWKNSFGLPEKNFTMLVYGRPGNGKTEFCIQFAKYMAGFTKVHYNSYEQGISKTLQDALRRNNMQEVAGKITFGNKENFSELMERLRNRNSAKVVFIDSRDFMKLNADQYKELVTAFPRKSFIIICWESARKPKGEYAKAIEFMVDIKVHVTDFKAHFRSRFGGNAPFDIWPDRRKRAGDQLSII